MRIAGTPGPAHPFIPARLNTGLGTVAFQRFAKNGEHLIRGHTQRYAEKSPVSKPRGENGVTATQQHMGRRAAHPFKPHELLQAEHGPCEYDDDEHDETRWVAPHTVVGLTACG